MAFWLVESGQRVKNIPNCHGDDEIQCLSQDNTYTRLYTGSTNGTVKVRPNVSGSCITNPGFDKWAEYFLKVCL